MKRRVWIYQRKGVSGWWIGWYENGRRRAKAFDNKALAERYKIAKEDEINAGIPTDIRSVDWPELLAEYRQSKEAADGLRESSMKEVLLTLRHFERLIGPVKSTQINQAIMERFIKARKDDPPVRGKKKREPNGKRLSLSTLNKDIRNIKTFLHWCVRRRYIHRDVEFILKARRVQQSDGVSLTPGQIEALLDSAARESPAWLLRVLLAIATGLRRGDVEALRIADVRLDLGAIPGRARKTGKTDTLPLPAKAAVALAQYVRNHTTEGQERLFEGQSYCWLTWKRIRERAGLPELKFHNLRGVYAMILRDAGYPDGVIQRMLQHSKISTTQGYLKSGALMPETAESVNKALPDTIQVPRAPEKTLPIPRVPPAKRTLPIPKVSPPADPA